MRGHYQIEPKLAEARASVYNMQIGRDVINWHFFLLFQNPFWHIALRKERRRKKNEHYYGGWQMQAILEFNDFLLTPQLIWWSFFFDSFLCFKQFMSNWCIRYFELRSDQPVLGIGYKPNLRVKRFYTWRLIYRTASVLSYICMSRHK